MKNVIIAIVSLLIGTGIGYLLTMKNLHHEIKIEQNNPKDFNTGSLITGKEAFAYIDNYKNTYAKTLRSVYKTDSITNAVLFDTSFIYGMYNALHNDGKHNGVRVYLGQYNKMIDEVKGQCSPTQLSLFFVATHENGAKGNHIDDTTFFKPYFKQVLNHGSLCPKICD